MDRKVEISKPDESRIRQVVSKNVDIINGQYGVWEDYKGQDVFVPKGAGVFVNSIHTNIDSGEKFLDIHFFDSSGRKVKVTFPRKDLTELGIFSLVSYGAQLVKQNAKTFILSIEAQEVKAKSDLYHETLGFHRFDNKTVFRGHEGIGVKSRYEGNLKIAPQGDFQIWRNMIIEEVLGETSLELMLAVGAAGVLTDYFKDDIACENTIVHLAGESSTGKSTAGLLCVSCGSCPTFNGESMVFSFADTMNALMTGFKSSYPALIEEGSLIISRANPTGFFYNVSMGKEKRRMRTDLSVANTDCFRTAIVTTSEKSLMNLCDENSGLKIRNIEIMNINFTRDARSSDRIKGVIQANYGFAVPKIAKYLLQEEQQGNKEELIEIFFEWCNVIVERAKDQGTYNPLTERAAKQMAMILLSAEITAEVLDIELDTTGILELLEEHSLVGDMSKMDIGLRAMCYLMQYVQGNIGKFVLEDEDAEFKNQVWGKIKRTKECTLYDGKKSDRSLYIADIYFDQILKEGGYPDAKVVLKRLKELKILTAEKDRYKSDICIVGGIKAKGYILKLEK